MNRRDRILAAAVEVFGTDGYLGTSTRQIAAAAGLKHSLLFYHFSSKAELYLAAFNLQITELSGALDAIIASDDDAYHRLRHFAGTYLTYFTERGPGLAVILREVAGLPDDVAASIRDSYRASVRTRLERLLIEGVTSGMFRPIDNVSACAIAVLSILNGFIRGRTIVPDGFTREEILEQVLRYYAAGLLRPELHRHTACP
ncbi:MAG: TetR/AcrR family transcriptional regulator [Dehalococcoidia bacterium]